MNQRRLIPVIILFCVLFSVMLSGCRAREAIAAVIDNDGSSAAGAAGADDGREGQRRLPPDHARPAYSTAVTDTAHTLAERIRFHDRLAGKQSRHDNHASLGAKARQTLAHYLQAGIRLWQVCMQQPFCIGTLETCTFSCINALPGPSNQ